MKKVIIVIIVIIILGVAYWLGSPLFIDKRVSEESPLMQSPEGGGAAATSTAVSADREIAQGTFTGFDRLHQGSGTVKVLQVNGTPVIRFEDDFTVSNGPDLYVGFGKDGKYVEGSEIARLKGNVGSQNYEVPATVNLNAYNEVWIWCQAFNVPFAKATLTE